MPILTQDIKIFESDTMDDTPQGGGAITGTAIVDGLSNNIFEDISTLDRTYGAVHMRKVFPSIQTQTQDKYFGSHMIISRLPKDDKIGINLFSTQDWFDRRPAAQTRVENYRAKGANYAGFLWATQWKDSKLITIFQGVNSPIPGIGDVLYLTQYGDSETQYVKIVTITESIQEFTDTTGVFKRRILNLEISEKLNYDFIGSEISRLDTITPTASIKNTIIANAAKYYSARPLDLAASNTDLTVKVDSVYSQVIPSSLQELAITDANMTGESYPLYDSAQDLASIVIGTTFSANTSFYIGSPYLPGTLSIPVTGGSIVDDGGNLKIGATVIGTTNYIEGSISFSATSPSYNGSKTVSFRPAAAPIKVADTSQLYVTGANRGFVWVNTLPQAPLPGSVRVSYRALGEWYTLYDNGTGGLLGQESGIGSGTINYVTGTISVTFSSLPDADSAILFSFGKSARYYNRSNLATKPFTVKHTLANTGVAPNTLVVTWNDGSARTASADAQGVITGDATGTVRHGTGEVEFTPTTLPLGGTQFTMDYDTGVPLSKTFNAPVKSGATLTLDLSDTNIVANSIQMQWNVTPDPLVYKAESEISRQSINGIVTARDNGAGLLKKPDGSTVTSSNVNLATGIITFAPDSTVSLITPTYSKEKTGETPANTIYAGAFRTTPHDTYSTVHTGYSNTNAVAPFPQDGSGVVTVHYRKTDSATTQQDVVTLSNVDVELTDGFDETIVPGSVRFTLGGDVFVDRLGSVFYDIDPATGAGTFGGTIDYTTGIVSISSWQTNVANTFTLQSLTTEAGKEPVSNAVFRVPSAPVKVQSLQVRANQTDGTLINISADATGYILGVGMEGWINYETGVVSINFGDWVVAAGNEGESWYNALAVVDGNIFKPTHVFADTILYNAVSQTFLPLDSSILGLNPVRLPQDGRIPVFADGDVVVVLNDQVTTGTYVQADTTNLGRVRISKLSVRDSAGQEILASTYTADMDLGTILWGDLTGISQPLTITDRIEDMAMLTDVQITGTLTLSQPLTHDFPLADTLVSNALIFGDLFARTSIPFDQQTWSGAWSDVLIGNDVSAQYNNSQYPIVVDNASCIEERWQILFSSATLVHVIGEHVGQILTLTPIVGDIAPINPNTAQPYFTIPSAGWGAGWSAGNVLRFNTYGAGAPPWLIQSIAQGQETDPDFTFCIEMRGDIDTV